MLISSLLGSQYLLRQQYLVVSKVQPLRTAAAQVVQLPWPGQGVSAIGAVGHGLVADSGAVDQARPIASITKLFTAWAVLQKKPLASGNQGPVIPITAHDEALYHSYQGRGGSVVSVRAGQQLTEYQALQALLLPSANNIADTLAVWAFGSMEEYLTYVNDELKNQGFRQTVLTDASGFSPTSVSSARDLVRLGELAMKQSVIAEIIGQPVANLDGIGQIQNTNRLVLGQQGIIGAKTGHTDEAGDCLLFMAKYQKGEDEVTIIGVLLGQPDRPGTFARAQALLSSAQAGFGRTTVASARTVVGRYRTSWGTEVEAVTDQDVSVFGWLSSTWQPDIHLEEIEADAGAKQQVGSVTIESGDQTYHSPVSLAKPLPGPSLWWRLTDIFS